METSTKSFICAACGWKNEADAAFCAGCGYSFAALDDGMANAVAGAPVVQSGNQPPADSVRGVAETVMLAVRESVTQSVSESVAQSMHSVRQSVVQSVNQLTESIEDPRRRAKVRQHLARVGLAQPPALLPPPQLPIERRLIYFLLVGSWLSVLWVMATWLMMLTVVGRPVAEWLITAAPDALTLHRSPNSIADRWRRQAALRASVRQFQHPPALRAAYFLLIGCWASLLWLFASYAVTLVSGDSRTSTAMFDLAPKVAYLERT